jgi:hypothetical protein
MTKRKNVYRIERDPEGRYYIRAEGDASRAWSGSRWVNHIDGIGTGAQVTNFDSRTEARIHAASLWPLPVRAVTTRAAKPR